MKTLYFFVVWIYMTTGIISTIQALNITSFNPSSGQVGTIITINGSGFDTGIANNVVTLGGIKLEILSATSTQLTVRVPVGVPSVAPIVVTNLTTQKTGSSLRTQQPFFTVTYPGGKISSNTYAQSMWGVGSGPFSIVSGDFNDDGKTDLATANYNVNTVSILTRNSTNTGFNPKVDFSVAHPPRMIVAADFNGDGKLDLATAAHGPTGKVISVLLRNSNPIESGGFTSAPGVTANLELSAIATGDVNGDGLTDLLSANYNSNNVSVFIRNAANNGFTHAGNYAAGTSLTNINSGDINGDGKMDIVTTNWASNNASVLLRNSANTGFNAAVNYSVGTNPRGLAIGDFNGDGRADLAIGNHSSFSVGILIRNAANNGFNTVVTYPVGIYVQWVVVGDFNGDGKSDLAVNGFQQNNATDPNVFILINDGNGTFQTPIGYFVDGFIRSMTTGDYNGDGMADLSPAHNQASDVFILSSNLAMWKGVNTDWDNTQNWWSGKLPTASSETVVKGCTICPQLSNGKQVRRFWIENATVGLNGNSIEISEDASVQLGQFVGSGTLQAADFLEFTNNIAHENLILRKTGGNNNFWKGGNRYKGELQIINTSTKTITPSTQTNDVIQN